MEGTMAMKAGEPQRPTIPKILIEATMNAIKAGMKPDEFTQAVAKQKEKTVAPAGKLIRGANANKDRREDRLAKFRKQQVNHDSSDEEEEEEAKRTYRNFDERRLGFLIIGDQHRFAGKAAQNQFIFAGAPPLDYSFCMVSKIEEIVTENETPQRKRNWRHPKKTEDERYKTSSLRLSYNAIDNMEGFINVIYKILDGGPFGLCWVDLSFNTISQLDEDTLSQLPNLKIMYLHGNAIIDMTEVSKLGALRSLKSLTLHGNPIEEEEGYRISILYTLPDLGHLDFIAVTKGDKATSKFFGAKLEPHWEKRHGELEARQKSIKEAQDVSFTVRKMKEAESESEDEINDMLFKNFY